MITHTQKLTKDRTIHQFWGTTSNTYIVEDAEQNATYLVDCGLPSDAISLMETLRALPPLKYIVCTHFHVDHITGWFKIKKILGDAEIWFHENARPFVSGQERIPYPSLDDYRKILRPCMEEYDYFPGPGELVSGALYGTPFKKGFPEERVRFFSDKQPMLPGFSTISTPGHRPDSISFFDHDSGILVCGDFFLVLKGELKRNTFLSNPKDQQESISKIKCLVGIRRIFSGHGTCLAISPGDL